jgi:hypothetical protein
MKTIPADQALRERHLKSALGHVFHAIAFTEALAGRGRADVDQLYAERGDLKHVALIIDSVIWAMW